MRIALLMSVLLTSCGPLPGLQGTLITTKIQNKASESLFTVKLTGLAPDAGTPTTTNVFTDERVKIDDFATSDTKVTVDDAAEITVHVDATTLGVVHMFEGKTMASKGSVITVVYDFDLALAEYTVSLQRGSL